jgi:hypothetical protein
VHCSVRTAHGADAVPTLLAVAPGSVSVHASPHGPILLTGLGGRLLLTLARFADLAGVFP